MIEAKIDTRRVQRWLNAIPDRVLHRVARTLVRAGITIENELERDTPVVTGRLRRAIATRRRRSPSAIKVAVGYRYGGGVLPSIGQVVAGQFGTDDHSPFAPSLRAIAQRDEHDVVDAVAKSVQDAIAQAK